MTRAIVLATAAEQPAITASDRLYADALERRGFSVTGVPWDGPRAAFELTLFGQIYDLAAANRLGIVQQTVAADQLQDAAIAWAALVPPD